MEAEYGKEMEVQARLKRMEELLKNLGYALKFTRATLDLRKVSIS